jgi:hypothetical protein
MRREKIVNENKEIREEIENKLNESPSLFIVLFS